MCMRMKGLFCACLLVGCLFHTSHCTDDRDRQHRGSRNRSSEEDVDHRFFLREIFSKYGHDGVMTFEGFEHLLERLGLGRIVIRDHDLQAHRDEDNLFLPYHKNHEHDAEAAAKRLPTESQKPHSHHEEEVKGTHVHQTTGGNRSVAAMNNKTNIPELLDNLTSLYEDHKEQEGWPEQQLKLFIGQRCLTATEILHTFDINPQSTVINPVGFLHLCPAIIYELDRRHCLDLTTHHHTSDEEAHRPVFHHVWLYATGAVVTISLCGLLSVAVIPIMQRMFYQTLLQYLVGLAIGSLSGDALLHLLPHAIASMGEEHDHHGGEGGAATESHGHGNFVWRGLTALGGVYAFFIAERLLNMVTNCRRRRQSAKVIQVPNFIRNLRGTTSEHSRTVGEKLSHHKHGSYGYSVDPSAMEALQKLNEVPPDEKEAPSAVSKKSLHILEMTSDIADDGTGPAKPPEEETVLEWNCGKEEAEEWSGGEKRPEQVSCQSSPKHLLQVDLGHLSHDKQTEVEIPSEDCHKETVVYRHSGEDHNYVVTVTDHHHHGHGHSHEVPTSVASVAWVVIMGDGLHNLCDGLAIGAAFAAGISSGLSTTIAVFCHELPHELGDFAMLLKAGMTVKQALLYNGLSSVLCFVGMAVGLGLGNIGSASSWIFAATAGMFLYIALVDMLPELGSSPSHPWVSSTHQLAVQFLGISTGICIMFLIAIYEYDLRNILS